LLTLPFGIAQGTKLRPVIHSGSFIGIEVPVWDIADNFGDTNLLVTNMAQANDLPHRLRSMRETTGGNAPEVAKVAAFSQAHGVDLHTVELYVLSQDSLDAAVAKVIADTGHIDVLIPGHRIDGHLIKVPAS